MWRQHWESSSEYRSLILCGRGCWRSDTSYWPGEVRGVGIEEYLVINSFLSVVLLTVPGSLSGALLLMFPIMYSVTVCVLSPVILNLSYIGLWPPSILVGNMVRKTSITFSDWRSLLTCLLFSHSSLPSLRPGLGPEFLDLCLLTLLATTPAMPVSVLARGQLVLRRRYE